MRSRVVNTSQPSHGDSEGSFRNFATSPRSMPAALVWQRNALLLISFILGLTLIFSKRTTSSDCGVSSSVSSNSLRNSDQCEISFEPYRGPQYTSAASGTIGKPKCLIESKWLKVSQHTVKFPGSDSIFDDWMWIDYHDRINVVVEAEVKEGEERQFLVFEQSKYALEGRKSLAIIGGIIEPGEEPEHAARREVDEEMNGLQCKYFHFLGRYRTDVNRGMGWVNGFLATACSRDRTAPKHQASVDEVGAADTERQDLKSITLAEMKTAVRNGEFIEVQWTAAVSLALLQPELTE